MIDQFLKFNEVNFDNFYKVLQAVNFLPTQIKDKELSELSIETSEKYSSTWYEAFNDEKRRLQIFERVKQKRDKIISTLDNVEELLSIAYLKNNETPPDMAIAEIKRMIDGTFEEYITLLTTNYSLADNVKHASSIVATKNRKKRQDKPNPNIEKARELAKEMWAKKSKQSLSDTAYEIKNRLNLRQSSTTVQEWIRDLNPNAKKKT